MRAMAKPKKTASARHRAPVPRRRAVPAADVAKADPSLFAPLTEGERADALRVALDDPRLRPMAKIGRYRVISIEPIAVKPPDPLSGRRIARAVIYDYAGDRCVEAGVDLDRGALCALNQSHAQPMLAPEEEAQAVAVALADTRVASGIKPGDSWQAVLQYWTRRPTDLAHRRRSAAVVFGRAQGTASLVAVVDLADGVVTDVVPAERW
jgi:hypothetical protein